MARLAEGLNHPEDRDAAADAIRGRVVRIVLTPGAKWDEIDATLYGALGIILEWTGAGNRKTDTPRRGMSVSVVAGAGFESIISRP